MMKEEGRTDLALKDGGFITIDYYPKAREIAIMLDDRSNRVRQTLTYDEARRVAIRLLTALELVYGDDK